MANRDRSSPQQHDYSDSPGLGANIHSGVLTTESGGLSIPHYPDWSTFLPRGDPSESLLQRRALNAFEPPSGVIEGSETRQFGMNRQAMPGFSEFTMTSDHFPAVPESSSDWRLRNSAGLVMQLTGSSGENSQVTSSGGVSIESRQSVASKKSAKKSVKTSSKLPGKKMTSSKRPEETNPNVGSLARGQGGLGLRSSTQSRNNSSSSGRRVNSVVKGSDSGRAKAGGSSTSLAVSLSKRQSSTREGPTVWRPQSRALPAGEKNETRQFGTGRQAMPGLSEFNTSSEHSPVVPGSSSDWKSRNSSGHVRSSSSGSSGGEGQITSSGSVYIGYQRTASSKPSVEKGIQKSIGKTNIQNSVDQPSTSYHLSSARPEETNPNLGSLARSQDTAVHGLNSRRSSKSLSLTREDPSDPRPHSRRSSKSLSLTREGPSDPRPQSRELPAGEPPSGVLGSSELRQFRMKRQVMPGFSEFTMSSEHFSVQPGSSSDWNLRNNAGLARSGSSGGNGQATSSGGVFVKPQQPVSSNQTANKGVQTSPKRKMSESSVDETALLPSLKRPEKTNSNLGSLAWGQDPTVLGLNLRQSSTVSRNQSPSPPGVGVNFNSMVNASGSGGTKPGGSSTSLPLDLSKSQLSIRGGPSDSFPLSSSGETPCVSVRSDMTLSRSAMTQPLPKLNEFTTSMEDFSLLPGTSSDWSSRNSIGVVRNLMSNSGGNGRVIPTSGIGSPQPGSSNEPVNKATKTSESFLLVSTLPAGEPPCTVFSRSETRWRMTTQPMPELTMEMDDFPVFPGTSSDLNLTSSVEVNDSGLSGSSGANGNEISSAVVAIGSQQLVNSEQLQTSRDGKVTNIQSRMSRDHFGTEGHMINDKTIPNLVSLTRGQDLIALGPNFNSQVALPAAFPRPWEEFPSRALDLNNNVPFNYISTQNIRDRLLESSLAGCPDELLFFLFYSNPGDQRQLSAASELYNREWRYHLEEHVWITHAHGCTVMEQTADYERGIYHIFDVENWMIVKKDFFIEYSKLAPLAIIPPTV